MASIDYSEQNRQAWQEAFDIHQRGYQHDLANDLMDPTHTFLDEPVIDALQELGLDGKVAGQFCCNNGRELLSVVQMGAQSGIGFDFAENFTREGARLARAAGLHAEFITGDIADIPVAYSDTCDLLLVTAGALTWFPDLRIFFHKAAQVLHSEGVLLIHEMHPFGNMLAMPNEEAFSVGDPDRVVYSYFKDDPWIENTGADYVGGTTYESKTFTSYSHTFSAIINAIASNGFQIERLDEFNVDISNSFGQVASGGFPLSYLLIARND